MSYFTNNSNPLYSYTPQRNNGLNHLQQSQSGDIQGNANTNGADANSLSASIAQHQQSQSVQQGQSQVQTPQQQQQQQQQHQQSPQQPGIKTSPHVQSGTSPQQTSTTQSVGQNVGPQSTQSAQQVVGVVRSNVDGPEGSSQSAESPSSGNNEISNSKPQRVNRPGHRFGAKKKSWVWSWFVQDNSDPNVAACDYCGKIIMRLSSDKGSPKKLSEHLKVHKVSKETINYSRAIPVDGYGVTYNNHGEPIDYPPNYHEQQATAAAAVSAATGNDSIVQTSSSNSLINTTSQGPTNSNTNTGSRGRNYHSGTTTTNTPTSNRFNAETYSHILNNNNRRFLSNDFDNSPYSSMKFHKHLMKFLTDNKLPITVIKSHSFQQLVYDLRSDSVGDLIELTGLYNTLLEVSRLSEAPDGTESES
ncbi:uncharacterized protein RJT21DRAFT_17016 [Scheffersomyces amazonensis]|uniref:uncharacterized protein n=1 Tax=Scheffersomyces amazonensis TaxID=1078765 RepID=UPI00315D3CEE